jgi:hypothetical protein
MAGQVNLKLRGWERGSNAFRSVVGGFLGLSTALPLYGNATNDGGIFYMSQVQNLHLFSSASGYICLSKPEPPIVPSVCLWPLKGG